MWHRRNGKAGRGRVDIGGIEDAGKASERFVALLPALAVFLALARRLIDWPGAAT